MGEGGNIFEGRSFYSERNSNPILKVRSEQGIQVPHSGGRTNLNKQIGGKTHSMRCLYTNAQSMGNKQDELELLVQQSKYDLMGITETWWDESHD